MDAFENVIAAILHRQGYWTATSVKVELTSDDKRRIRRPSSPRWELDVVAYSGKRNELLIFECKSYLDSPGVLTSVFTKNNSRSRDRYKLFFDLTLREVVFSRLKKQLFRAGFCAARPKIRLGLAAGKIQGDAVALKSYFKSNRWLLWGPGEIRTELVRLGKSGYENSVAAVVSKVILRETIKNRSSRAPDSGD